MTEAKQLYARWLEVLLDERDNARRALPVMEADMRLDFYHGFGGISATGTAHGADMIRKKLEILDAELSRFLPSLARRCGFEPVPAN